MDRYKKTLVGLEIEKYVGKIVEGHNCDFEYKDAELKRYRLVFNDGSSLLLWNEYGECYSGWTTASWGRWEWSYKRFPFSYSPKGGPVEVEILEYEDREFEEYYAGPVLQVFLHGELIVDATSELDEYYPSGGVSVKTSYFTKTARSMVERPVWIFQGPSALGKSTLAAKTGAKVFETDSVQKLPGTIWADIVVVGNKHKFSIKAIKHRLPKGSKPILVNFLA